MVRSRQVLFALWLLVACGDDDDSERDGSVAEGDAGRDAGGATDAGADAGRDAAATGCGDGVVGPGEACDGDAAECGSLGASWGEGSAPCRDDCAGWDPRECAIAAPGSIEMVKPAERDAKWETARCNDGTPFGFSARVSQSADWVIYLQGGVYCDDYSFDCTERVERAPGLTTTPPVPDGDVATVMGTGILSRDADVNPTFARANQVLAFYCSSDFWAGATAERRPTTADPDGWYFSGHSHVGALFELLAERYGLDDRRDDLRVLFGGGSAGAFGAHFNASLAAGLLPRAAADGRLRILVDAGWNTDWDDPGHRLGSATDPDHEVYRRARELWGAEFDPACEAVLADPIDCFFGPGWYPAVSAILPVLVQQSPTDVSFLAVHGLEAGDPAVDAWRAEVESSLEPVEWLFSGDAVTHTLGLCDLGLSFGPEGASLGEVITRFLGGEASERVVFEADPPPGC